MLLTIFFLLFLALSGVPAFFVTKSSLQRTWAKQGPKYITDQISARNRRVLLIAGVVAVVLVALEALLPPLHEAMVDFQYVIGDRMGAVDPIGVVTFASGGGMSWGLYLLCLLGLALGLVLGSLLACRRGDAVPSVSPQRMLV